MPPENIISQIERALSAISASAILAGRPNWQDDPNLWSAIGLEHIQSVVEALEQWPTTAGLRSTRVTDGLGFSAAFDFKRLAQWLVYRSGKVSIAEALGDVERFVSSDAPEMLTVFALGGIRPEGIVQLDSDMVLMPITQLPPSQQGNQALGIIPRVAWQTQLLRPWPTAAIAIKYRLALAISSVDRQSQKGENASSDRDTRLTEAQLCMAVACKGVVDLIAAWSQPADVSTPAIFPTGVITYGSGLVRRLAKEFDQNKVERIIKLFWQFQGGRETLHVPLERLNSAMAHASIVDRAIDLGIALESLLMHETSRSQHSDNQELRFKIGIRGAWLGGGTPEERHDRFLFLRELYDLRSRAVHSGRITRANAIKVVEQLDAGENLCAELLQRVLEMNRWPDWSKLVVGAPMS